MKVFSVYDSKSESYCKPIFAEARGLALRSFSEAAAKDDTEIGKYPSDFTLFELGDFDVRTAKFELHTTPVSLGVALEFISK